MVFAEEFDGGLTVPELLNSVKSALQKAKKNLKEFGDLKNLAARLREERDKLSNRLKEKEDDQKEITELKRKICELECEKLKAKTDADVDQSRIKELEGRLLINNLEKDASEKQTSAGRRGESEESYRSDGWSGRRRESEERRDRSASSSGRRVSEERRDRSDSRSGRGRVSEERNDSWSGRRKVSEEKRDRSDSRSGRRRVSEERSDSWSGRRRVSEERSNSWSGKRNESGSFGRCEAPSERNQADRWSSQRGNAYRWRGRSGGRKIRGRWRGRGRRSGGRNTWR